MRAKTWFVVLCVSSILALMAVPPAWGAPRSQEGVVGVYVLQSKELRPWDNFAASDCDPGASINLGQNSAQI